MLSIIMQISYKNNDIESFVRNSLLDTKSNSNKIILILRLHCYMMKSVLELKIRIIML